MWVENLPPCPRRQYMLVPDTLLDCVPAVYVAEARGSPCGVMGAEAHLYHDEEGE